MNERPILFSGPMIRAILEGRKTQTRRVVTPQPEYRPLPATHPSNGRACWHDAYDNDEVLYCPYGAPGDRLWVRETFRVVPASAYRGSEGIQQTINPSDRDEAAVYAAGWDRSVQYWKPSIHMPRWASRITLELTGVRVQQLRDISGYDALREGVTLPAMQNGPADPTVEFMDLWDSINAKRGYDWASNPWVWVLEFRRTS